jgi:hypothetical protein
MFGKNTITGNKHLTFVPLVVMGCFSLVLSAQALTDGEVLDKCPLDINPDLTRVHLELAGSYINVGQVELAKPHFRYAQNDSHLPPNIAEEVTGYLAAIKKRKSWSLSFDFSSGPQTNINRAPTIQSVQIGGMPFKLNDDARKKIRLTFFCGIWFGRYADNCS